MKPTEERRTSDFSQFKAEARERELWDGIEKRSQLQEALSRRLETFEWS